MPIEHVAEPSEITIKDGNVIMSWPSGETRAVPLRVFRITHMRASKALAEHDIRTGQIVPMRSKGRKG
jgi:hypothetical protein